MSILMNRRKLSYYAVFFMTGIVTGFLKDFTFFILSGTGLLFLFLIKKEEKRKRSFVFFLLLVFFAGNLVYFCHEIILYDSELSSFTGKPCTCTAVVTDIKPGKNNMTEMVCRLKNKRVLCSYKGEIRNPYSIIGRKITFTLYLKKSEDNIFALGRRTGYYSYVSGFLLEDFIPSPFLSLKRQILLKQYHFTEPFIKDYGESGKLIPGVLFGNTAYMEKDVRELFSSNGTAHILAVSGLHIGILYSAFLLIFKRSGSPLLTPCFIILLFLYGTASSWSVSVIRAVIMILLLMMSNLFCRRYDMVTALFFSSVVILVLNPYAIFTISFHMSFLAVIFIAFTGPVLREYMGNYAAMVISVQAGLGPYMLYVFQDLSLKGILCNIPAVFIGSIIVPLGALDFFLYFFTGIRSETADTVIAGLSDILIKINEFFGRTDILTPELEFNSFLFLVLYYVTMLYVSSEFFTVHRLRKEYYLLAQCYFLTFIIIYVLAQGALSYAGMK